MIAPMRFVFAFLMALIWAGAAQAEPAHAIASHGVPKYSAGFGAFDYVNKDAPKGGQLRIALTGTFDSLNPYILKGTAPPATYYNSFVYESLLYRSADEPFTMYPWIAEKIEVAPDRSDITFFLNPKARWQDGQPITADDIQFTYQTLLKSGRPNIRTYYGKVATVDVIDQRTVRYSFKQIEAGGYDGELPLLVSLMPVLPKHLLEGKDFAQTSLQPLPGSGAYRVTSVEAGRKIMLQHVDNYWAADLPVMRGQQNFQTITLDFYRDEMVARQAVLSGAADFKVESDKLKLQKAYRSRAVDSGEVVLEEVAHQRPEAYRGFVLNTRRAPFSNPILRHAIRAAANFPQINQTLFGGAYQRSRSSFANSVLAATGPEEKYLSPETYRARLRDSRDVLLSAGYKYRDEKLIAPDGQPVSFEILLVDSMDERIALAFARQLRPLGIMARVRTVDSAQFQARLNDFDFDVMVYRWVNSLSPGNEQLIYWGSKAADIKGSRNYPGVCDAAVDAAIEKLLAAKDYAVLTEATRALDQLIIDGDYVIPFFYCGADLFARRSTIRRPAQVPLTGYDIRTFWAE